MPTKIQDLDIQYAPRWSNLFHKCAMQKFTVVHGLLLSAFTRDNRWQQVYKRGTDIISICLISQFQSPDTTIFVKTHNIIEKFILMTWMC